MSNKNISVIIRHLKKIYRIMLVNIYTHLKSNQLHLVLSLFLLIPGSLRAQTISLEQCIDTALHYNRAIKLSQQDVLLASEKNKETKGNLLPKLNGMADYRYYTDLPYQLMPALEDCNS